MAKQSEMVREFVGITGHCDDDLMSELRRRCALFQLNDRSYQTWFNLNRSRSPHRLERFYLIFAFPGSDKSILRKARSRGVKVVRVESDVAA